VTTSITILSDQVTTVPIVFKNAGGTVVAPIAGDTFTVVSSSASLGAAVVGVGSVAGPSLVLTPKVLAGSGYVVTVSDTAGLPVQTLTVTISVDPALATQWSLTVGSPTTVTQAIPTNAGP
jgi:hypothetical protein